MFAAAIRVQAVTVRNVWRTVLGKDRSRGIVVKRRAWSREFLMFEVIVQAIEADFDFLKTRFRVAIRAASFDDGWLEGHGESIQNFDHRFCQKRILVPRSKSVSSRKLNP